MHPLNQPPSSTNAPQRARPAASAGQPWKSPWSLDDDLPPPPKGSQVPARMPEHQWPVPPPSNLPPVAPPPVERPTARPAEADTPQPRPVTFAPFPSAPVQELIPTPKPRATLQIPPAEAEMPKLATPPDRLSAARQVTPATPLPAALRQPALSMATAQQHAMHQRISDVMSRERRNRMSTFMALALSAFIITALALVYIQDQSTPDDTDLAPEPPLLNPTTPKAPDRLRLALEASKPVISADKQGQPPWEWDTPLLSRTVEANATAYDHLRDLMSDDDWQPRHPVWSSADTGSHPGWEALAIAKSAAVAYFARRGEEQLAFDTAIEMAAFGRRLQALHAWPTLYPRTVELHERACELIAHMLRTTQLDSYRLGQLQFLFERSTPSDAALRDALNRYYRFEHRLIIGPRSDDAWDNATPEIPLIKHGKIFFKPNTTLQIFVTGFRSLKNEVVKVPYARTQPLNAIVGPQGMPQGNLCSPNISGNRYANQRLWSYGKLVERQGLQSTRHIIVLTLFATRRFIADTGRAPKTLSELVPKYFTDLPIDPCSGQALSYDPLRGLIWSVGMDFSDAGGHLSSVPLSDGYEPTVSIK